ncbi:MAG: hypothetical protein MUO51_17110 [Woeseiaceae bacterium]|nr:hypothetical protein [Woeseiaceae bacterium]
MRRRFPLQTKGTVYLTEGGQETEIMYKFGRKQSLTEGWPDPAPEVRCRPNADQIATL